jgi:aminopeptidase-like protein
VSMNLQELIAGADPGEAGGAMHALATELFPFCRSITGEGVRQTLRRLQNDLPLKLHEVPTGTQVFDWTVPKEWNVRDAWIKDPSGRKVVDFNESNLHVLNYSTPVHGRIPLTELDRHLYTLPEQPEAIPYKTSYYKETWGFCLSHAQRESLPDGEYEYCIDSSLEDGSLSYGEVYLPGRRKKEILFSAHVCHPSLANDNLSGIVVLHNLAQALSKLDTTWSYRFIFAPGTIGAITWLAQNQDRLGAIEAGLVVAGVGDPGDFTYKRTRRADAEIDLLVKRALRESGSSFGLVDFSPDGYDERQYNSPGIELPVGRLSRTPYGTYPEYHTSGDTLDFIRPDSLGLALEVLLRVCALLESSPRFRNLSPRAEPQLGRRGLYSALGGHRDSSARERAMQWVLNYSDGEHCLADIAERSGLGLQILEEVAALLEEKELLGRIGGA